MAGSKNDAIEDGNSQVAVLDIALAKVLYQGYGNDVNDTNGNHRTDGATGIQGSSLINILRHGSAQRSVWQVDAGIASNQDAVGDGHVDNLGCLRPLGMGPEGEHQYQSRKRGTKQQPRTEPAPTGLGLV